MRNRIEPILYERTALEMAINLHSPFSRRATAMPKDTLAILHAMRAMHCWELFPHSVHSLLIDAKIPPDDCLRALQICTGTRRLSCPSLHDAYRPKAFASIMSMKDLEELSIEVSNFLEFADLLPSSNHFPLLTRLDVRFSTSAGVSAASPAFLFDKFPNLTHLSLRPKKRLFEKWVLGDTESSVAQLAGVVEACGPQIQMLVIGAPAGYRAVDESLHVGTDAASKVSGVPIVVVYDCPWWESGWKVGQDTVWSVAAAKMVNPTRN